MLLVTATQCTACLPNGRTGGPLENQYVTQAQLAGRDFTAERGSVVVISNGMVEAKDKERSLAERRAAEERNAHRQVITIQSHLYVCPEYIKVGQ